MKYKLWIPLPDGEPPTGWWQLAGNFRTKKEANQARIELGIKPDYAWIENATKDKNQLTTKK